MGPRHICYFFYWTVLRMVKTFYLWMHRNLRKSAYYAIQILLLSTTYSITHLSLDRHQRVEEKIVFKELQETFVKHVKEVLTLEIIDGTFNENSSGSEWESFVYKLNSSLDGIFSNYLFYEVKVNNIVLATNIYTGEELLTLIYCGKFDKGPDYSIHVGKNYNSQYFQKCLAEEKKIKNIISWIFLIITVFVLYNTYLRINDIGNIEKYRLIYNQIKDYEKVKKKITTQFHSYFMSTRQQILAIPLLLCDKNTNLNKKISYINLEALSIDLKEYAVGYIALKQSRITLNIKRPKGVALLKINSDPEILHQIIFSILCNILYFVKNLPEVTISISFDQAFVEFKYNKAFPVNAEVLKINSDPIILNEISEHVFPGSRHLND